MTGVTESPAAASAAGAVLLQALRAGGKRALASALSRLEAGDAALETTTLLDAAWAAPQGVAVALTGPPGVGKSTLIDALLRAARRRGLSVGVIAVDPSSTKTGGALLGDRTRIAIDPEDREVFLRSLAARDRLGGLSDAAYPAAVLMRATKDLTLIETVGVGQSETDAAEVADASLLCVQPASGDSIQFMKAGVMESPDVVLVTKADLGAPARRAAAEAAGALSLAVRADGPPPVLLVSATAPPAEGGVDEALARILTVAHTRRTRDRALQQVKAHSFHSIRARFGAVGVDVAKRLAAADAPAHDAASPRSAAAFQTQPFTWAASLEARLAAAVRPALDGL